MSRRRRSGRWVLPGKAVRFDYQDIDSSRKRLFIAHMNDASVVVVSTVDGSLIKVMAGISTPRGIAVASDAKRVFVTSSPNKLVIIDSDSLTELGRVATGRSPDGVAWDSVHRVVGVSDQGDGALSIIADSGTGARKQIASCAGMVGNECQGGRLLRQPGSGASSYRVIRSGSWFNGANLLAAASRNGAGPARRAATDGFRCARTP